MAAPYGTTADVAARLPRGGAASGDFGTTDKPSKAQVTTWIAQVSSRVDSAIRGAGLDPSPLASDGLNIVTFAVTSYVAGMVERTWAGVGMGSPDNKGQDLQAPLLDLFKMLNERPGEAAQQLGLAIPTNPATDSSSLDSNFFDDADLDDDTIYPDNAFKRGGKF